MLMPNIRRRISGNALAMLVAAVGTPPGRVALTHLYRRELGIDALRTLPLGHLPLSELAVQARPHHERNSQDLALPAPSCITASKLQGLLELGEFTARELAERSLEAARSLAQHSPSLEPIVEYDDERAFAAAERSDERRRLGRTFGALDGIPVAIKEEAQMAGFTNRYGSVAPDQPEATDCPAVQRLREAGAVIIGRTPMTEYGASPLGENVHRTMPRNPHDTRYLAGGSSTGSAVAVVTGVVPMALGSDGGGSIRVPAAAVGAFGLKPTFGRIPVTGASADNSLVHFGPIACSSLDLAQFIEATAGPCAADPASLAAPALLPDALTTALKRGVSGLRIGLDEALWSKASSEVTTPGKAALEALRQEGVELVPIQLPYAEHAAALGYITFSLEMVPAIARARGDRMREVGLYLQLISSALAAFEADDYLMVKRLRGQLRRELRDALVEVDLIALPTTAEPATLAGEHEQFFDPDALDAATRYAFIGNLSGLPAGTAPAGKTPGGLPVGLQLIADAWDEATILQVMGHLERMGVSRLACPPQYCSLA